MSACRLIVFEKTSHWAVVLRAELAGKPPRLVEVRSWADCQAAVSQSLFSLVAIEVTAANVEAAVERVVWLTREHPNCRVAALLAPEFCEAEPLAAEWLVREAGAIEAICSVLEVPRLARLASRLAARAPRRSQSIEEFIADRIPWPGLATVPAPANLVK
jgi:hypothetical protein